MTTMFKECSIKLCPTSNQSSLGFIGDSSLFRIDTNKPYVKTPGIPPINFQYLYILSEDEIKVGDWVLNLSANDEKNTIFECDNSIVAINAKRSKVWKKIIASTNPKIKVLKISNSFLVKYCKAKNVEKVLVEYHAVKDWENYTTIPVGNGCATHAEKLVPKLTIDNKINIKL